MAPKPPSGASRPGEPPAESPAHLLVSFDIDGTLEFGEPPGPVPAAFVRDVKARGWVVGSCSDRTLREQRKVWGQIGIEPDFVVVKTGLDELGVRFAGARLVHIGDTAVDQHYALRAGFEFVHTGDWREDAFSEPA